MKHTIIRPNSHDEWLECRTHGIGSSEIGTILGLNKYETPFQLWQRKTGQIPPQEENEAMLMGHILEPAVAQRWAIETGNDIMKESEAEWIYVHPKYDYFRASPDRLYWEKGATKSKKNICVLECKTTALDIDKDNIPQTWFCQVQWLMFCIGCRKASLAWLKNGREFDYKNIAYDEDFCEQFLAPAAEKFWKENVQDGIEPEIKSVDDVLAKYPKHTEGKSVDGTLGVQIGTIKLTAIDACRELKEIKDSIKELELRKDEIEDALKIYMGDAEKITIKDSKGERSLATWKAATDGVKFDFKRFKEEQPELCKDYMITTKGARKFLLKGI